MLKDVDVYLDAYVDADVDVVVRACGFRCRHR